MTRRVLWCLALWGVVWAAPVFAAPPDATRGFLHDSIITLNLENDMFGGGTDRHYTSGLRLTYLRPDAPLPAFARAIDMLVPTFAMNETTGIYYALGHNLYTPEDITQAAQISGDRPWAAFLYATAGMRTRGAGRVDDVEATLGVVGPAALGRQVQSFVHKHISDSPRPRGWDNQIGNEPAFMLSWERSWPARFAVSALGGQAMAVPHLGATVGNVYTYANTGAYVTLGLAGHAQGPPVRVRPAMPGDGAFAVPDREVSWYLFAGADGRWVLRNIFLDGNTWQDSYSVKRLPLVFDATAGLALTYGHVRASYALVYRSREFETQDKGDVFGTMSLGVRF